MTTLDIVQILFIVTVFSVGIISFIKVVMNEDEK
jgi:hypothetical protein